MRLKCIESVICFKNLVKTLRSHSLKNLKKNILQQQSRYIHSYQKNSSYIYTATKILNLFSYLIDFTFPPMHPCHSHQQYSKHYTNTFRYLCTTFTY